MDTGSKILDAILARPDTTLSVLLLLAVVAGLIWVIRQQAMAMKEAMAAVAPALKELTAVVTDLRIEVVTRDRKR